MSVPKIFNISQKEDFTQQDKLLFKKRHKRYYFRTKMDNEINYSFDTKFREEYFGSGKNWMWQNNICPKSQTK